MTPISLQSAGTLCLARNESVTINIEQAIVIQRATRKERPAFRGYVNIRPIK